MTDLPAYIPTPVEIEALEGFVDVRVETLPEALDLLRALDEAITRFFGEGLTSSVFADPDPDETSTPIEQWQLVGERLAAESKRVSHEIALLQLGWGYHVLVGYCLALAAMPATPMKAKTFIINRVEEQCGELRQTIHNWTRVARAFHPSRLRWALGWTFYQRVADQVRATETWFALDADGRPLPGDTRALQDYYLDWAAGLTPQGKSRTRADLDRRIQADREQAELRAGLLARRREDNPAATLADIELPPAPSPWTPVATEGLLDGYSPDSIRAMAEQAAPFLPATSPWAPVPSRAEDLDDGRPALTILPRGASVAPDVVGDVVSQAFNRLRALQERALREWLRVDPSAADRQAELREMWDGVVVSALRALQYTAAPPQSKAK